MKLTLKPLVRVVAVVALLTGTFHCKADWEWEGSGSILDPEDPIHEYGTANYFRWATNFDGSGSVYTSGNTATWSANLTSEVWVTTRDDFNEVVVNWGHTNVVSGQLYADAICASWVPNEEEEEPEPPTHIKLTVDVGFYGVLNSRAVVWQERYWEYDDPGDIIWAVARVGASASGDPGAPGAPGGGASNHGGITNGLPNSGIGGYYQTSGVTVDSNDTDGVHDDDPNFHGEAWAWWSEIHFSIDYSDDYIVPNNGGICLSPSFHTSADAEASMYTAETNYERSQIWSYALGYMSGGVTYAAEDYNY